MDRARVAGNMLSESYGSSKGPEVFTELSEAKTAIPEETDARMCSTGERAASSAIGPDRLITSAVRSRLGQPCG